MKLKIIVTIRLIFLTLLIFVSMLTLDGLVDTAQLSDVGIVLCSQVLPNGTPAERLQARLDKANELTKKECLSASSLVVAMKKKGFNEAVIADNVKIPRTRILLDQVSFRTYDIRVRKPCPCGCCCSMPLFPFNV